MVHIFFDSLSDWLQASGRNTVYAMPYIETHPIQQGIARKELRIILSYVRPVDDVVYHCILLIATRLDPTDRDKITQQSELLDNTWTRLTRYLLEQEQFAALIHGFVSYSKDMKTIDAYLSLETLTAMEQKTVTLCNN